MIKKQINDNETIIEFDNGTKFWYNKGRLHRYGGPAAIYSNGVKKWYINGHNVTDSVHAWMEERGICYNDMSKLDYIEISIFLRGLHEHE